MPTAPRTPTRLTLLAAPLLVAGALHVGTLRPGAAGLSHGAGMSAARAAHTATTLRDGRVLVAGGFTEKGSARGAELYDPSTGRFAPLPPMVHTRHSHTATLLADGRVLLAGGYAAGGVPVADVEVFDPATNRFAATGALTEPRSDHIAVPLPGGRILFAGGLGPDWTFLSSAEVYDPASGRSTRTGAMSVPRESHVGVRLRDGRVLVVGGHAGRRAAIVLYASAEIYDATTGRFTRTGDMASRRHKHDATLLADGRVLVNGGSDERDIRGMYNTTEIFDPARGTFSPGPVMHRGRYKHAGTATLLANGQVLLAGGAPEAELLDPVTRRFVLVPGTSTMAGNFSAVAALQDGAVLITGGYGNGRGPQAATWLFRP
ncbi:MAG: hypothetical protein IT355_15010 [Gemmatimonadaceae bacterium]|nr:hypothetical protein [Gemmatimonadaceae bacterium]